MLVLSGFLTDAECDFIKKYASHRMVPSGLATMDSTKSEVGVRTSTQTFMERGGTAQIKHLEERAHNLTRLPYDLGENIQVVRYEEGQKYGAHRDFFDPNDYHRQPSMLRSVEYGARNRLATVFFYLNNVSQGGQTNFPRAGDSGLARDVRPPVRDYFDCSKGLSVFPQEGKVIIFYSMLPNGEMDEMSLHGGCDVLEHDEKWSANFWLWNKPYHFLSPKRKKQAQELLDKAL